MDAPATKGPSLWPREHGAYMELGFPLAAAWLLAAPTLAAYALGLGSILTFLAHEPLLIVAGRRGQRRRDAHRRSAFVRLLILAFPALAFGFAGLLWAGPEARLLTIAPAVLGAVAMAMAVRGTERSLIGELLVACALVSVALPVAAAGGLPIVDASAVCAVWLVGFLLSTAAARGVVFRKKDGGRLLRWTAAAAAVVIVAVGALLATGTLPTWPALAALPLAMAAAGLSLRPPSPKRMSAIGFALTGACVLTLVGLVLGLR